MFDSAKRESLNRSLKSPNTKVVPNILLQLSQWATYALLNSLSRKSLQSLGFLGLVFTASKALTEFLRHFHLDFQMPPIR
jgi:hypothetical protein